MKQYDETEFTLISNEEMKNYQWLIKDNIKRNRRNGIISNIVIYTFISVIALTFIFMVTKDIFFENYPINFFNQEERMDKQDKKIEEINQKIEMDNDYESFEEPTINNKVKELESRVDEVEGD